jgi:undecaprenyl diphosphate synthase
MSLKEQIDPERIPAHIAIIMDGNGRWAKGKGKARIFGHRNAIESVRAVSEACAELGVKYLTLYAFSTENWNRPKYEVNALMELLVKALKSEVSTLQENKIRLRTIGDTDSLPAACRKSLQASMAATEGNSRMDLILALSYSSRWEMVEAIKKIIVDARQNKLTENEFDDRMFSQYLTTKDIPDPELMIRTSGEERISNFLLWQIAYTELYFTPKLWPDFRKEDLYAAILNYQHRERRFGKTSEQISA